MSLTKDQQEALNAMMNGRNIFLTGEAGTGKSFVLREFLKQTNKNVLVTAPTGIAAINVNGATLHRTFGAPIGPAIQKPKSTSETIIATDIIVIDEISMCRIDLFDFVMESICLANKERASLEEPKKPIQLILVGDFFQLPPVLKKTRGIREANEQDDEILKNFYKKDIGYGFAFQSQKWHEYGIKVIKLHEVVRQKDKAFIKALNQARIGNHECLDFFKNQLAKKEIDDAIYLCSTNAKASEINTKKVQKIKGDSIIYQARIEGVFAKSEMPTDEELVLKEKTRVMILKNDPNGAYVNGSLGTVTGFYNDSIDVLFDHSGQTHKIAYNTWESVKYVLRKDKTLEKETVGLFSQLPIRVAYAITIHKSQGQTLDKINLYPSSFSPGQLYVALSRATSSNGLYIEEPIKSEWLICSDQVKKFYKRPDRYRFFKSSGGSRKGAGRKANPLGETVVIRIPVVLKEECEAWIQEKIENITQSNCPKKRG